MRDDLQITTVPDGTLNLVRHRITVPGAVVRVVAVTFDTAAHISQESISCRFNNGNLLDLHAGTLPIVGTAPLIAWMLGAEHTPPLNISFNPATGVQSYIAPLAINAPLPDIWWDSRVPIDLMFESTTNGETFTNFLCIKEVKFLDDNHPFNGSKRKTPFLPFSN